MKTIVLHSLKNYSLSNLNRGEDGQVKNAPFGDAKRQYISSQCLNRAMQEEIARRHEGDDIAVNTKNFAEYFMSKLPELFEDKANAEAINNCFANFGKKEEDDDSKKKNDKKKKNEKSKQECFVRTRKSVFDRTIDWIKDELANGVPLLTILNNTIEYMNNLDKTLALTSYELATGRMSTDAKFFETRESASYVAPALGITKYEPCTDFFTAVDDFTSNSGSGMLGHKYITSSAFYTTSAIDLDQLIANDRDENGNLRESLESIIEKIMEIITVRLTCNPSGMQNSEFSKTKPFMIMAEVADSAVSYSDAFVKAIVEGDPVEQGIEKFTSYVNTLADMYDDEVSTKYWMSVPTDCTIDGATKVNKFSELLAKIREEVTTYLTSKY